MTRARIPAAMLRELKDLQNPKKTSAGSYLLVPKTMTLDQWQSLAMPQQAALVAAIRN